MSEQQQQPVALIRGRDVAVGLSLSNLLHLRLWGEVLAVTTPGAFYSNTDNSDIVAVMVNVVLLAALFVGMNAFARRFGATGRRVAMAGFVFVIAMQFNAFGPILAPGVFTIVDPWREGKYLDALAPVLGLGLIAAASAKWPQRALRITVGLLMFLSPLTLVLFGRALLAIGTENPTETLAAEAPALGSPVDSQPGPRVVVIVMDAMTRRFAIDERPASLKMPELDRLRSESIDATRVDQADHQTKLSFPSLLSGLSVARAEPADEDELALTLDDSSRVEWSDAPNLFEDAKALGGVAVVAGWYFPYCRMFPELDGCATHSARVIGARGRSTPFLGTMRDQAFALIPYINLRRRQIAIVEAQRRELQQALATGGRGLVLLHLIEPHTPWIWDAERKEYTLTQFAPRHYFGNLALADVMIGEARRAMEANGTWDSSAVLLLSDHVVPYLPRSMKVADDRRVPFVLKLPGAKTGVVYDKPFSASVTYPLVRALLRGELTDHASALRWLDRNARAP